MAEASQPVKYEPASKVAGFRQETWDEGLICAGTITLSFAKSSKSQNDLKQFNNSKSVPAIASSVLFPTIQQCRK